MEHMLWIGESTISRDKVKTLKQVISEFSKIKIGDIKRVAKQLFNKNKYNLSVVGPIDRNQSERIEKLFGISK